MVQLRQADKTHPAAHSPPQKDGVKIRKRKVQKFVSGDRDSLIFLEVGERNHPKGRKRSKFRGKK